MSAIAQAWQQSLLCSMPEPWVTAEPLGNRAWHRQVLAWKTYDSERRVFERTYGRLLAQQLRVVANEVAAIYRGSGSVWEAEQMADRQLTPRLTGWFYRMHLGVEQHFIRRAGRNLRKAEETPPDPFAAIVVQDLPELVNWNTRVTAARITAVRKVTREKVRAVVDEALRQGYSIPRIAKQLRQAYAFSKKRAVMIARTEVISASNAANHFAVAGQVDTRRFDRVWLATRDDRTRDTHKEADGQRQPWGTPYKVGDSELMFPGDPSLDAAAEEVINCRCTEYFVPRKGL